MGWKSKLIRRKKKEHWRRTSVVVDDDQSPGKGSRMITPIQLKSCFKRRPCCDDDGENSFSSCSDVGSNCNRPCSHETSLRTSSTAFSAASSRSNNSSIDSTTTPSKNVRFHEVYIREYDRTVGDNPSVSVGPPVGLDWKFQETIAMDLTGYESCRGRRRKQLEMVLTKHERENLLFEWGVPQQLIADGTRSALKIKNHRKQTVVNAGKVARLEEIIEKASKRFKGAFSLTAKTQATSVASCTYDNGYHPKNEIPRTERNRSVVNSTTTSKAVKSVDMGLSTKKSTTRIVSVEPATDILDQMGMSVALSNVVSSAPEGALMTSQTSLVQYLESNEDRCFDDTYTLGATTLGHNSESPSVLELERFYQELEREMFGEEDTLPCMVGQTLELGACTDEMDAAGDEITIASSVQSISRFHADSDVTAHIPHYNSEDYRKPRDHIGSISDCCDDQQYMQYSSPETSLSYHHHESQTEHNSHQRRGSGSFDISSNFWERDCHENLHLGMTSSQRQWHHFHTSSLSNQLMVWNQDFVVNDRRAYLPQRLPPLRHHVYRPGGKGYFDGPQIFHTALQHGHLSPNQWMGECDEPISYVNAAVTIMEDSHAY